jgi:hypothetical protein
MFLWPAPIYRFCPYILKRNFTDRCCPFGSGVYEESLKKMMRYRRLEGRESARLAADRSGGARAEDWCGKPALSGAVLPAAERGNYRTAMRGTTFADGLVNDVEQRLPSRRIGMVADYGPTISGVISNIIGIRLAEKAARRSLSSAPSGRDSSSPRAPTRLYGWRSSRRNASLSDWRLCRGAWRRAAPAVPSRAVP